MNKENIIEEKRLTEETEIKENTFIVNVKKWFGKHKTEFIIGGSAFVAIALGYILKQSTASEETIAIIAEPLQTNDLIDKVKQIESKRPYTIPQETVYTKMHPRNLHLGQHASQSKIDEAAALGIILKENQTLVNGYSRYN